MIQKALRAGYTLNSFSINNRKITTCVCLVSTLAYAHNSLTILYYETAFCPKTAFGWKSLGGI